jgi:hypothetical protein
MPEEDLRAVLSEHVEECSAYVATTAREESGVCNARRLAFFELSGVPDGIEPRREGFHSYR